MINRNDFRDFLIIDRKGKIIYADIGNPQYFDLDADQLKGKLLHDLFPALEPEYPTLKAAKEGIACGFFQVELKTRKGIAVKKTGCAYPIFCDKEPIGAIEFADFFYDKAHIGEINRHADHLIYRKNNTKYLIDDIITADPVMKNLKEKIEKYAISDSTVLIWGETGTGKELVAQALHNSSRRYGRKFVSLNCSAMPQNLIESILFGTTKGSFTGAEDKVGLFEQADGGTLFLDEINSLAPDLQTKLLQAVENKTIRRIGSQREIVVDVRIVAATNEDPRELVQTGRMKADLFHRLAVISIELPRLVDRSGDILLLADYYIRYFNQKMNMHIKPLDEEITWIFLHYSWPGNVRELRNVIESAVTFAEGNEIRVRDLPDYVKNTAQGLSGISQDETGKGLLDRRDRLERDILVDCLHRNGGRIKITARELGISSQLLCYKLKKYREESHGAERRF
ncbi:MAG: sigma-54 interaction domain-containing protein [Emergencia sp.]|nr:sigma 54-interacting transcriptional regulator [Emergencia sp.]